MTRRMRNGALWHGWLPGIWSPPPRSLRTDSDEWRRWYLVVALDTYGNIAKPVTDRNIAVAVLLAGGLDRFSSTELRRLPDVINAERKAVALVRRRALAAIAAQWKETR